MCHVRSQVFEKLPYSVIPIHYDLCFTPNLVDYVFDGKANIKLNVTERTDVIIMNSKKLTISSATFMEAEASVNYDEDKEQVKFSFASPLQVGEGELKLAFQGLLLDDMKGFYRSKYKPLEGPEETILCTQFEPADARKAFPCMDEPDRKATFKISMVVPDNRVCLSNMPEKSRSVVDVPQNHVCVHFDESPLMSTYLVAMVVGAFDCITCLDENSIQVRVFTPPGKQELGQFALEVATQCLPFYTRTFGYGFPLPKLDFIAIPDFASGAMENWGLITYRETRLLIDPKHSSTMSKTQVALTVAHELAHMWFGNLVTMAWWTHLWLNEGFATWIEYLAVDHCFPHFDIWMMFASHEFAHAMKQDELKTSHPIEVEVNSPDEIEEIFDAISYEKGAAVIRMLSEFIGFQNFRLGLQRYIRRHAFGNTVTEDLWQALADVSTQPVAEVMATWTRKTGFPVLSVRLLPDGDSCLLGITQSRFLVTGQQEDRPTEWFVPLVVCEARDSSAVLLRTLLRPSSCVQTSGEGPHSVSSSGEQFFRLPQHQSTGLRLNPRGTGFYRVHYDNALLPGIMNALTEGTIPERDRLSLIDDQFAMARSGRSSFVTALEFARAFTGEQCYSVWNTLSSGLEHVRFLLQEVAYPTVDDWEAHFPQPSNEEAALIALSCQIANPVYKKLGWEPKGEQESTNDRMLRPLILSIMGRGKSAEIISEAFSRFQRHYEAVMKSNAGDESEDLIPADLRAVIYSICLHNGGEEEFNKLLHLHDKAGMQDERVRILRSLGCVTTPALLHRVLALSLSDFVRKQDRFLSLLGVTWCSAGRRALWQLIRHRIKDISDEIGSTSMLAHLIKGSCSKFCSAYRVDEMKAFFDANPVPCERSVQQTLESISVNSVQLSRDIANISRFLAQFTV